MIGCGVVSYRITGKTPDESPPSSVTETIIEGVYNQISPEFHQRDTCPAWMVVLAKNIPQMAYTLVWPFRVDANLLTSSIIVFTFIYIWQRQSKRGQPFVRPISACIRNIQQGWRLSPSQVHWSSASSNPGLHEHLKLPGELTQICSQHAEPRAHSSSSVA